MPDSDSRQPVIEIGVVVVQPLEPTAADAVDEALDQVVGRLSAWLDQFDWRLATVHAEDSDAAKITEVVALLDLAQQHRDARGWDFALVVTGADLVSHYKPFCFAAISSALDAAVVSTARIDPESGGAESNDAERRDAIRVRTSRLTLHCLGHWLGLGHEDAVDNVMRDIESVDDLQPQPVLTDEQLTLVATTLEGIADARLEEQASFRTAWRPAFYLRAAWENRAEIRDAVLQARPWQFPILLSRLTTAAVSTVLILLMTAETWDMASSQGAATVAGLSLIALAGTTAYVAVRQKLLLRRDGRRLTEQIVTSNVAAVVIVATGMLVTYGLLAALALAAGWWLFPAAVLKGWAASVEGPLSAGHRLLVAGIVASLGIVIGALGASFEQNRYFRHVVFVDEEL